MKLRTYCLTCKKYTNNIASKKVTMINKVIRDKSRLVSVYLINQDF